MGREALAFEMRESAVGTFNDGDKIRYCMKRWAKLTEGVQDPYRKRLLAVLAENEFQHLQRLNEETKAINVGSYTKHIFPILRRLVPNLLAPNLVSVQPMLAPIGGVFVREAKFGTSKGAITKGQNVFDSFDADYSSEKVTGELLATGDGTKYGGAGAALSVGLTFFPVRPLSAADGFSLVLTEETSGGTVVQTATDDGTGGFTGNATAGTVNYQTGAITGFKFTAAVTNGNLVRATYQYDMELNDKLPEVNLDITLTPIVARPRKMRGTWSPEASDDFRHLHGIDGESDLTNTMTSEMSLEIDREIVLDLLAYATSSGTNATYDRAVGANDDNETSAILRILTAVSDVSQQIHQKTRRSGANWIVTSPAVGAILMQLARQGDFQPALLRGNAYGAGRSPMDAVRVPPSYNNTSSDYGMMEFGLLGSTWTVYQDPLFNKNKMLMGFKGSSYLDSGYVWAPYIMLLLTPTFYDPRDFSFRKGIRSRYAKQRLRPEWYGSVTISNMSI